MRRKNYFAICFAVRFSMADCSLPLSFVLFAELVPLFPFSFLVELSGSQTSFLYDNRNKCFSFSCFFFFWFSLSVPPHTALLHTEDVRRAKNIFYFNNMLLDILPKHFAGNHFKWFNFFVWPSLSSDYLF